MERTLSIIKPDAVKKNVTGKIISLLENSNLEIKAIKKLSLSPTQAEAFYAVHRDKPFYRELVNFMCSGNIVVILLESEDVIKKYRELMGSTDSTKALPGTIRTLYGTDIQENAVHGSDSVENAQSEINFFFSHNELL